MESSGDVEVEPFLGEGLKGSTAWGECIETARRGAAWYEGGAIAGESQAFGEGGYIWWKHLWEEEGREQGKKGSTEETQQHVRHHV